MRRVFTTVGVAAAVIVGALAYWYLSGGRVEIPSGSPISISILVEDQPLATITNGAGLDAVMKVLRSGRAIKLHDCAAHGRTDARFANGQTFTVAFGPGHEPSRYEFGVGGRVFTVPRSQFLDALKVGGVDIAQVPRG